LKMNELLARRFPCTSGVRFFARNSYSSSMKRESRESG